MFDKLNISYTVLYNKLYAKYEYYIIYPYWKGEWVME